MLMDSSDPSTTSGYSDDEHPEEEQERPVEGIKSPIEGTTGALIDGDEENNNNNNKIEKEGKFSEAKILVYVLILFIDLLIPLMLILSAISCMSVMGMIFVLLLYLHIIICNKAEKSFTPSQICLAIDFVINLIVFVFACIGYTLKIQGEWIKILGLDFDNIIASTPTFTTATSLIAMICQLISMILITKTDITKFRESRIKMFSSLGVQFGFDLVWAVCNAFNAASNSSYLYLPILLFFVVSNISQSMVGYNCIPQKVTFVVMAYSLLFALFELYMVSYIGEEYNPASALKYNYIAEDNTKGVNVVIAVIFAYISVQNMSAPGLNGGKPKPVPAALKVMSDGILIIAFLCTLVFAMFYPNYLSILWILIPTIASFVNFQTLRKLMFPMLTIIFTITFVSQACTTFYLFDPPKDDGVELMIEFVRLFGLYKYPNDFTFTACGFYIICLLGQIGKITHVKTAKKKKNDNEEDEDEKLVLLSQSKAKNKGDDNGNEFDEEEQDEEELMRIEKATKRIEAKRKRKERNEKVKKVLKKIGNVIYTIFSYVSVAAIIIIGITIGFYEDRFVYKIICCIFMFIVLLALYRRTIFEVIKIVSALMMMFAAFYKTTMNQDCYFQLDKCLLFGQWDDIIENMILTGLIPPIEMSLAEFIWPIAVIFALSTFLTADEKALKFQLPPFITSIIFIVVAILHFLYMFLYDTSIFSLLFFIVGTMMLTSQYLNKRGVLAFSCCLSCIVVSFQIVVLLLSHFPKARNLITSVVPKSIIDISEIYGPSFEICLLAGILFLSTIAFNTFPGGKMNYLIDSILYEVRVILDLFYFYLCWVFIFMFSIVNNNASFIKFLLMLFFAFGRWSAPIFWKIRIPFLIFNIVYLVAQFACHIFDFDDNSQEYYPIMRYIGMYFNAPNKPTNSERNLSVAWQLVVIVFGVINAKPYIRKVSDPKFDRLLSTRIYNAICAMLHHWLAIIIQISLCTSTLFNPSLFGWFSYVVMILVNYNEHAMNKYSNVITLVFNICFMIQYILFLGYPKEIFRTGPFDVTSYVTDPDKKELLINWLKWIGIYDVKIAQLTSNCISAFFFTFYLTWHNTFVDYDTRFNDLPDIMKQIVNFFSTYVFEIMFSLILIVSSCVRSIDGALFFILASILFLCALLMNYPKFKALNIMSIATFVVILLRLLSRLPIFIIDGMAKWIKVAFDVPLDGSSRYENLWIIIYALERLTIHIMKSKIYKEVNENQMKHQAFRFIRSRQIAVLERIDQDILNQKHIIEIDQIRSLQANNVDKLMDSIQADRSQSLSKQKEKKSTSTVISSVDLKQKEKGENDNKDNKVKWYSIFKRFFKACIVKVTKLLAGSLHMNSEAGINVLTLYSLTDLMQKVLRTYETGKVYVPEPEEKDFFEKLPPSFPLHLQSIADIINYRIIDKKKTMKHFLTYLFLFIRRLPLPLLTFMILIYMYIKPYLFSMIVIVMFCCLLLPLDIKGFPIIYQVYLALVMFLFVLRNICTLDILKPYILEASNSVTVAQMSISVIKLFGIDPEETSIVEIFLFLFTVYFIVDQLQWCQVYPPNYYLTKFRKNLPGFPKEYTYGIINDPIVDLELDIEKPPGFFKQLKDTMSRAGLIETSHSTILLIIDVVSFILILILWGMWTHGTENNSPLDSSGTASFVFRIDVTYVFMLLIQCIFSLSCYAFSLSSNHICLYITNVIWFIYTYCISNFLISAKSRQIDPSLQFYIFVRFFWHLVAEHECFRGRRIVAFKYPNFTRDWRLMLYFNKFIRICPFVFEIQTILIWMSQMTKVSLLDFFVFRDVQLQLENLICLQSSPDADEPAKKQSNYLKGGLLLLLLTVILFVPLFFFSSGTPKTTNNAPTSATLEIGLSSFAPFFTCKGQISQITPGQHQAIANTDNKDLYFLVLSSREAISLISFPAVSFEDYSPPPDLVSLMTDTLRSQLPLSPFFRLSFFFNVPTTISTVQNVVFQRSLPTLSTTDKENLVQILRGNTSSKVGPILLPTTIVVPIDKNPSSVAGFEKNVNLELNTASSSFSGSSSSISSTWELNLPKENMTLSFMESEKKLNVLLWSQEVNKNAESTIMSTDASIVGIYLLIILTLGMVLRVFALALPDNLWIKRMDKPQQLYRMAIAVNAFRAARDLDKEKELTDQFLNTLRSKVLCLKLTDKETF